jgi:hypothetical protein
MSSRIGGAADSGQLRSPQMGKSLGKSVVLSARLCTIVLQARGRSPRLGRGRLGAGFEASLVMSPAAHA